MPNLQGEIQIEENYQNETWLIVENKKRQGLNKYDNFKDAPLDKYVDSEGG
jgi:hypothetical protein